MKLKIKLVVAPGDMKVDRAAIKVRDASGMFLDGQVILEGETVEQDVTVDVGQTLEIAAMGRPVVLNPDDSTQAVHMDLTPKDPLAKRAGAPPPTEPTPKVKDEKHEPKAKY